MKKIIMFSALLCIILTSCSNTQEPHQENRWVCNCEQKKAVADFVSKNVGPANNMSDEEMEDVITTLYNVGVTTNCTERVIWLKHNSGIVDTSKTKLDSCEVIIKLGYIL